MQVPLLLPYNTMKFATFETFLILTILIGVGVASYTWNDSLEKELHPSVTEEAEAITHGELPLATRQDHQRQEVLPESTTVDEKPETQFGWLFRSRKPYSLFEEDTFRGNLPTDDNFEKFCKKYDLVPDAESFAKFERVLEIDALTTFVIGYRRREIQRFKAYEPSRLLYQELEEVMVFIHNLVIDEAEFWSAVDDYSLEVIESTIALDHGYVNQSYPEYRITSLLFNKKQQILKP